MSRIINETKQLTINPASFSARDSFGGSTSSSSYYTNEDSACNPSSNTSSYARFTLQTTSYDIYYNFDLLNKIPQNAVINSVTGVVRAAVSRTGSTCNIGFTTGASVDDGITEKGSTVSINSTTNYDSGGTLFNIVNSTWTWEELQTVKCKITIQRSGNNTTYLYLYGIDLNISYTYNGVAYSISSLLKSTLLGSISPDGVVEINPDNVNQYNLLIHGNSFDDIVVKDNEVDVTSQCVQYSTSAGSFSLVKTPVSAELTGIACDSGQSGYPESTAYQNAIGVGSDTSTNTTTNLFHRSSQAFHSYVDYGFDFSDLPQNAIITSITVSVKGHAELDSGSTSVCNVQLYSGNTTKSEKYEFTSSSNTVYNFDNISSWTATELQNARLRWTFGISGGFIVGATFTVNYVIEADYPYYWVYTLNNINADHDIIVTDTFQGQKYPIYITTNTNIVTLSNTYKEVKEGGQYGVTIYTQNIHAINITDNNVDIKSSIVGADGVYSYTINDIHEQHTIRIVENTWYSIDVESLFENATIETEIEKAYEGESSKITVNISATDLQNVEILDNDTDITSSFTRISTGIYQYTLDNIDNDHEIKVIEKNTYQMTVISSSNNITVSPSGNTAVHENDSFTVQVFTDFENLDLVIAKDNDVNIKDSLVFTQGSQGSQDTIENILPNDFTNTGTYNFTTNTNYPLSNAYTNSSSTNYARLQLASSSSATRTSEAYLEFDKSLLSGIPSNATCTVTCKIKYYISSTTYVTAVSLQLCSGTTKKGTAITNRSTSASTYTINGGNDWTVSELSNLRLYISATHSARTNAAYLYLYGADITISYDIPDIPDHYEYRLTNITEAHTISFSEVFIPVEEDETKTYYSITTSSINSTTDPENGTIRVEESTNQEIRIYPKDNKITLATDNGNDISSQLVFNGTMPTYTVDNVSGASYNFELNSSTQYYTSTNNKQSNSAALARINLTLPDTCLVTIKFINYSEATYDYGIFGEIDTALDTSYTSDTNAKLVCDTSTYNISSEQTITYEVEAGSHFIDVKYRKDPATDSYNDNLQFKIESIEVVGGQNTYYYTYNLQNIRRDHTLVFIFGDVEYYTINSSGTNAKLYPINDYVVMPGDSYALTIVPNKNSYSVDIYDNGRNVNKMVEKNTIISDKDGTPVTIINYIYRINKVKENHTIVVNCLDTIYAYIKLNGTWTIAQQIYVKTNNIWVTVEDLDVLTKNKNIIYYKDPS